MYRETASIPEAYVVKGFLFNTLSDLINSFEGLEIILETRGSTHYTCAFLQDHPLPAHICSFSCKHVSIGSHFGLGFWLQGNMSDSQSPHDILQRLARPGLVPNSTEDGQLLKFAGMCWHFCKHRIEGFLRLHSDRPISVSYQSDCTPSKTQETFVARSGDDRVIRAGARSSEFLLHRLFARTPDHHQCVLFGPLVRLEDKTVMTHVHGARQYMLYPFQFGCRTINITHVVFDGALWDPLSAALYNDHAMAIEAESRTDDADPTMLSLCSWFARTPCVLHSCHNSFKWALKHWLDDNQRMKDVWAIVASLRSSFGSLQPYLSIWVSARLVFRDQVNEAWPYSLWCVVGLHAETCSELDRLQLCFSGGCLVVSAEQQDSCTIRAEIYMVLLKVFRVMEWSDSRWLGASRTSRQMLAAILLGIEDFVQFAVARGHSTWSLCSFQKLDPDIKQFFVQAAIGAYPADACMDIVIEDDRVPIILQRLDQEMQEELQFVLSIGSDVWRVLADAVGSTAAHLRSSSLEVAFTSAAYLTQKMQLARSLPWSCLTGSASESLDLFAALPPPEEELSLKIWTLIRLGMDRTTLEEGISLVQRLSWSTNTTEQGHSAASRVLRHHRVCAVTMQVRSVVCQARALFSVPVEETQLENSRAKLRRLQSKHPQTIGAKSAFLGELLSICSGGIHAARHNNPGWGKRVVARHGACWRSLTSAQKHVYEHTALALQAGKSDVLQAAGSRHVVCHDTRGNSSMICGTTLGLLAAG